MEILILAAALYFVPSVIAFVRSHGSTGAVVALNMLLGWTLLGWVAALIWAMAGDAAPNPYSTRKCPKCFGEVDSRATICRHCRSPL